MKAFITIVSAAFIVAGLSFSADAATAKKTTVTASKQATCKAQAAKKYTAVHFLKRRAYVKQCMGQKA